MKLSTIFLLPVGFIPTVAGNEFFARRAGRCGLKDVCLKGVTNGDAVDPPLTSRLDDCKALYTVTVSPYAVTTTSYVGELVVRIPTGMPTGRQVPNRIVGRAEGLPTATTISPTIVPPYATYCPTAAAYYSACSRAGVTPFTTTLETPTSTVTVNTDDCYMRRMVKRGGESLGYEFEEGWDGYNMPGIKLF
ncbi:hypothetical protein G7Z17_g6442 [Cylindrodendrum hubeiense]|uniref:Uncharacterized protein n=1 Tax=Cylindrodendrum hubeiense TaxID=595255 RepID=A0A9P5HD67_9HYPO|nr:hypothetical protein G7Z17_g6442 [Cylindrodendrum hubeiense]